MKTFVVISDTHGNITGARQAAVVGGRGDQLKMDVLHNSKDRIKMDVRNNLGPASGLIHLGDGVADGEQVAGEHGLPFFGVYGNEDRGSDRPERLIMDVHGWRVLLLHGHQFDLNPYLPKEEWERRLDELVDEARAAGVQALLFGHTHRPLAETRGKVLLGNPGNQYAGSSRPLTFGWLKADAGRLEFQVWEQEAWPRGVGVTAVLERCY
ncbi:MAG: metallophosphoesterase family protein [Pseudomonadota bacterium]